MADDRVISAEEIALYDRQIRLWGIAAQTRMRAANVLLVNVGALSNEIAKNIVLGGIGSLTVLDSETVSALDLGGQFFLEESDIGSNRAGAASLRIQKLNPRVVVSADSSNFREKTAEYYAKFDIIVATDLEVKDLISINDMCRQYSKPFYAGASIGLYGYIFADLVKHTFSIEREKSNISVKLGPESSTRSIIDVMVKKEGPKLKEIITKQENYKPLSVSMHSDNLSKLRPRSMMKVSPVLPAIKAMWKFHEDAGSQKPTTESDLVKFHDLVLDACRELGLPVGIISPEFTASFAHNIGTELSPVAAILGGVLAQDILNYLGQREQPIQNWVIFDGASSEAPIYSL
ncbi:hypothetical protein V1509DRAFT_627718 [Lipomyces kononenkoae]